MLTGQGSRPDWLRDNNAVALVQPQVEWFVHERQQL